MLAYVFWHWRRAGRSPPRPMRRCSAASTRRSGRRRRRRSCARARSRYAGAPWAADGGEAYEDWYLLEGSAALDPLNAAAVTASRQAPHDAAAAVAAGGTAGLYLAPPGRAGDAAAHGHLVRQARRHELRATVRGARAAGATPRAPRSGAGR